MTSIASGVALSFLSRAGVLHPVCAYTLVRVCVGDGLCMHQEIGGRGGGCERNQQCLCLSWSYRTMRGLSRRMGHGYYACAGKTDWI